MPTKRSRANHLGIFGATARAIAPASQATKPGVMSARRGSAAPAKFAANTNNYICGVERNQNGKYNVRVQAAFAAGGRDGWTLPIYFLASSFNAAMKKLEESLQILQKNEDRLRFWAVERTDDPNLAGDFLEEFGLWLDRRQDFPRKTAELAVVHERTVPASMLAAARRILADSVAERPVHSQAAAAGD
ncbi:MAG: hypothetical protein LAN59_14925 [Acidobacteriia bacterium]|nr:hypothetical protein [Terriglobia bacterium]